MIFENLAAALCRGARPAGRTRQASPRTASTSARGALNNALLNRLTAGATGLPRHYGPRRGATAIGNLLVQAVAAGHLASLAEGRQLVARSFPLTTFDPSGDWAEARARFARLTAQTALTAH
ncbi:MAG: hypothetical protein U0838_02960 [Chloroflexota bacterium]